MSNPIVTPELMKLLRAALGLGHYVTKPTRSWLSEADAQGHEAEVETLIDMELLSRTAFAGLGGVEKMIVITEEGRRVAMEAQHALH